VGLRGERRRVLGSAARQMADYERNGLGRLSVCIAKTHLSISSDPACSGSDRLDAAGARGAGVGRGGLHLPHLRQHADDAGSARTRGVRDRHRRAGEFRRPVLSGWFPSTPTRPFVHLGRPPRRFDRRRGAVSGKNEDGPSEKLRVPNQGGTFVLIPPSWPARAHRSPRSGEATVGDAVASCPPGYRCAVVSADGPTSTHRLGARRRAHAARPGARVLDEQVASIMSTTVYTCSPGDDTESLMTTMTERRVRHVPSWSTACSKALSASATW